jgi:hypothetical protein
MYWICAITELNWDGFHGSLIRSHKLSCLVGVQFDSRGAMRGTITPIGRANATSVTTCKAIAYIVFRSCLPERRLSRRLLTKQHFIAILRPHDANSYYQAAGCRQIN